MEENKMVDWTFEVDEEIERKAREFCKKWGLTLEGMTVAFIKFCATPENKDIVEAYLKPKIDKNTDIQEKVFEEVLKIALKDADYIKQTELYHKE